MINGLLLPGGGADLSAGHPFYDAMDTLVTMAMEANDKGDFFPVSRGGLQGVGDQNIWGKAACCLSLW